MMKQFFGVGKDICSGENKFFKLVKVSIVFWFHAGHKHRSFVFDLFIRTDLCSDQV